MATFYNRAALSYNGNVISSNITTGELVEVLTATKSAVGTGYAANDIITYVINIVNSGSSAFTGLTLTDNLGAYTYNQQQVIPLDYVAGSIRYYSNGGLQPAPDVSAGPPLTISSLSVPANGNVTIIYEAQANRFAPPGADSSIINQATITGGVFHRQYRFQRQSMRQTDPPLQSASQYARLPLLKTAR